MGNRVEDWRLLPPEHRSPVAALEARLTARIEALEAKVLHLEERLQSTLEVNGLWDGS